MAKKSTIKAATQRTGKKTMPKPRRKSVRKKTKATTVAPSRALSIPRAGFAAARVAAVGNCLDLISAGEIVQDSIPGGPHDVDSTLENAGLITTAMRIVFREDVVRRVKDRGCTIDGSSIPNSAGTTLREARKAVRDNAGS